MARGVCRVLIPETLEGAFLGIVAMLKMIGASLANPGNGKITTWTDDGDQVEIPDAEVIGKVASGDIRNVQFWKTESKDVFVAWREDKTGYLFSLYLDGLENDIAVALVAKLAEAVLAKYRNQYDEGAAFTIEFE